MRWVIDRIEGNYAVIECNGNCFNVPTNLLPEGAKDGDVLDVSLNYKETENIKTQLKERLNKLFGE